MKPTIAILGTRGIPNHYGGYEQAASFLAKGLAEKGYAVTVYNSHTHPWKENTWEGVEIVHCKDPEQRIGTAGQFIYDWNCIRHARKRKYDVLLLLGYTSSSVWGRLYPPQSVIVSHMDGLEWKRSKYSRPVQRFLKYAEKLAIRYSDYYIADSPAIHSYLAGQYRIDPVYIPYGAVLHRDACVSPLAEYGLQPREYFMLMARMEPENNIETILRGYTDSGHPFPFLVVGHTGNAYGKKMIQIFGKEKNIRFAGAIFDQEKLYGLRHHCRLYFHGHSVGGTNPSLLEAMASAASIAAHDNPYNRAVTGEDARYFTTAADVKTIIQDNGIYAIHIASNLQKIQHTYNWQRIVDQYESFILDCYKQGKR